LFSLLFIPLSILLFNQATPAGFLANIVAIPALGFLVLPLTLLASFFAVLDFAALGWLFSVLDKITGWLIDYLQFLQTSVLPASSFADRPGILLASLAIAIFILLLPVNWRARVPAVVLLIVAFCWQPGGVPDNSFRMTVLDVGMGTAVAVETRHHTLIYDFGPGNADGFSAGDWVVRPYLHYRGIEKLDLMVISHVDSDHSGGFISFKDEIDTVALVSGTPQALAERFKLKNTVPDCHSYAPWRWDGVDFEFIASPLSSVSTSTNNQSCVLKVSAKHSVLLSGDIEAEQETSLVHRHASNLAADVLLAPHHGSLSSSTESFIDAVGAGLVIFTAGRNNRWGFPRPQVVARYQQTGSQIYRSDTDGAVTLLSTPGDLYVDHWRKAKRIWH
ncbi:MAG: DNA internalization-related competence protein ComEC/Rec2, partial [Gammaproteobacteria bacterium]|nr:DNA internalization-related competence protein ComEC/Rec2 [Gammaproteobacteria bacterium]